MTRRVPAPPPPKDPRSVTEAVLGAIFAVCGDDPKKLRNVLSGFQTGHEIAVGIARRLNELEANLPGFKRGADTQGAGR